MLKTELTNYHNKLFALTLTLKKRWRRSPQGSIDNLQDREQYQGSHKDVLQEAANMKTFHQNTYRSQVCWDQLQHLKKLKQNKKIINCIVACSWWTLSLISLWETNIYKTWPSLVIITFIFSIIIIITGIWTRHSNNYYFWYLDQI